MNDTGKLYGEYMKIKKIIKSSYDIEDYDENTKEWIESHYKKIFNGYKKVYLSVNNIRNVCQAWLDRIVFENNINRFPKGWMDMIYFWVQGKYKERKRFMEMFYTIYYDMATELDALDGGPDMEKPATTTGFAI